MMTQQAIQKFEQGKTLAPDVNEFTVMKETASMLVKTGFLPQAIKTPEQAIAIILTGRELGIGTMAALNTINVIQGKPTVSPQLMLALIERSGQLEDIQIEPHDGNAIRCTMKRKGRSPHTEYFGDAEAAAMQLSGKDNYKKQKATMYRWRAVAACARIVFPDVITGLYTPDELGADVTDDGELLPPSRPNVLTLPPTQAIDGEIVDEGNGPDENQAPRRNMFIDTVNFLCKQLNEAGDSIKWTKGTLHEYINELFSVADGLDSLSFESFDILIGDLEGRLESLKAQ